MSDFILSCCSTVDLTKDILEKRDIHFISLHFEVDGKAYTDDFGESISADELYEWIEAHKLELQHWLFSTDLTFFIKGGRISKTAGFVGNLLNICPLIDVSADGKLTPRRNVRTKKKVMEAIVDQMETLAKKGLDYSEKCLMCHSGCLEDAKKVAAMIEERFQKLKGKEEIFSIGPAIGCHAGPGTVGVFFWGTKRA